MYKKYIKRLIDITLSFLAITILTPVYIIVSIIVVISMGMPVLFSQVRIGKDEKNFKLYKFRSMSNATDREGNLLNEQKRLTNTGIFLRSTSLDELPELFSILKGDMSFVGPRPLPTYYGPFYLENERMRHTVKGGLIPPDGLSGETTPNWEVQFAYDVYYAKNITLKLDINVIIATIEILLKRMNNNYGAEIRPHLSEYRKDMCQTLLSSAIAHK